MIAFKRVVRGSVLALGIAAGVAVFSDVYAAPSTDITSGAITQMTVFSVKPERTDAFLDVMRKNIAHSLTEDGNEGFHAYTVAKGKTVKVYVLETWRDAAAQKAHAKQPTLIALHDAFAEDLVTHPESSPVRAVTP